MQTPHNTQDDNENRTKFPEGRALAPILKYYNPGEPSFVELRDPHTIPTGHARYKDKAPAEWAKLLWESPWKVTREGEKPKGKLLPIFFALQPIREVMARAHFFMSGKRKEEHVRDKLANVESAFMYCLGEVQVQRCGSCVRKHGPLAKCVIIS